MKKSAFLALLAAGVLAASTASAAQQPWIVKGGLGYLMPKSSVGTVDFGTGKLDVEVDDGWGFVFSVGYMFDEHWALEVLASSPFSHDITIKGAGEAETDLLPPTVSALYYFNPGGRTRPYLGAGINFTEFFNEDPDELHLGGSVGPAAAAGLDFMFTRHWFATLDLRWIYVDTEVKADGSQKDYGHLQLNPLLASVMVGYRFGGRRMQLEAPAPAAAPAPVAAAAPVVAAAPEKCSDGDGDGVCDADDKCPNTPAGDKVDKFGCSLVSRLTVYFDFDSAELRPESITELERVVRFMNDIPSSTALVEGHTDSIGTEAYNLALSDRRAKAVYDYLTSRGVDPSRLRSVGLGEANPVASNETAEGRQLNRRVMLIRTDSGN
jgi:outer membrane protein OmpA-like peptidoglycan-associated protein